MTSLHPTNSQPLASADGHHAGIRIGCAGWSIRSNQSTLFGEGGSQLARYATCFDCVEINSSFYRSHQRKTYARWAAEVPDDFRFSVKLPKSITHQARLRDADARADSVAAEPYIRYRSCRSVSFLDAIALSMRAGTGATPPELVCACR